MARRRLASAILLLAVTLAACSSSAREGASSSAQTSGRTTPEGHTKAATNTTQKLLPVELVPTDAGLLKGCRRAAAVLGFAVPCPTRLPPAAGPVRCEVPPAFSGAEVEPKEGCALGAGFLLEPQGMENRAVSHLVIEGSGDAFQSDCGEQDPHRRVTVRGYKALLIECPETAGLHASHVLLRWVEQGTFVTVSSHGQTDANRQLIQEIAAGIQLVAP